MSFLRDTGGAAILQIFAAGLQFLAGVLVARGLGSDGKGIQALVLLIPDMTRAVTHFGFGVASTRQIVKEPACSGRTAANLFVFAFTIGSLSCLALYAAFPWLRAFVEARGADRIAAAGEGLDAAILLAILGLPLLMLEGYVSGALTGRRAILAANLAKLVQTGCYAALVLVFFQLGDVTVTAAVKAWVLSFVLGDLTALVFLWLVVESPRRPDLRLMREAFRFGVKTIPTSISIYLLFRIDLALVRFLRSADEVGVYSIAVSLTLLFQVVGFAVERALVPRIMGRSGAETAVLTPIATRSFLLVGAPAAVVMALVCWPLVPLVFGVEYAGAVLPLAIILPGQVIGTIGLFANTDLIGRGFPGYASLSASIALAINIGLNLLLIPSLGIVGAALASLVCYAALGLTLLFFYRRLTGVGVRTMLVPQAEDWKRILWVLRGSR